MPDFMTPVVAVICDQLDDTDLAVLHLCATLDGNPKERRFDYSTVAPLFTDADGTRMHALTKDALNRYIAVRRGRQKR